MSSSGSAEGSYAGVGDNVVLSKELAKNLISREGWFQGIDDERIAQIVELSNIKRYSSDEFIYMLGDQQSNVFCILDGRVKVSIVGQGGDEFVLAIWEAGICFGESSFHDDGKMPLEARVLNDATVLVIPHSVIEKVLEDGTIFYRNIMLDMIGRAKDLYRLVEILLFRPLHAKLAARVLHFISIFGEECEEGIVLPIKLSQSDLAGMSGGSRQRVNQIFRKWAASGIVTKMDKYYVVHDVEALTAIMEDHED